MARRELWDQVDGDLYAILRVSPSATSAEIQSAWRAIAKQAHPDLGGSVSRFQAAEVAYQVLANPGQRLRYDHYREMSPMSLDIAGSGQSATRRPAYRPTAESAPRTTTYFWWTPSATGYEGPSPATPPDHTPSARPRRNPWLIALAVIAIIMGIVALWELELVTMAIVVIVFALGVAALLGGGSKRPRG